MHCFLSFNVKIALFLQVFPQYWSPGRILSPPLYKFIPASQMPNPLYGGRTVAMLWHFTPVSNCCNELQLGIAQCTAMATIYGCSHLQLSRCSDYTSKICCTRQQIILLYIQNILYLSRCFDYISKIYCTSTHFFIIHPKSLNKTARALIIYTKYNAP